MLKKALPLLLLLISLPLALSVTANTRFEENLNYFEIFPAYPGSEPGKIEVMEFFWYNCPHCYDFEPHLQGWLKNKPADVNFVKVPAIFNPTARFHAETFYTLEMMGADPGLHQKIFTAIHEQKQHLDDEASMAEFLAGQGVDAEKFRQTLKSFAVQARVNRADEMVKRFGITGVPSMVINGAWRTGRTAGFDEMLQLVDFLVNKSREEHVAAGK